MTDFDYDVKVKKDIARSARNRKNGRLSRGCKLPHETMTEHQLQNLNGQIEVFKKQINTVA